MTRSVLFCVLVAVCGGFGACSSTGGDIPEYPEASHAKIAAALSKAGRYDEAIAEYQRHMEVRREVKNRPASENPSFYYVLIGDVHLKQGDSQGAQDAYAQAEADGVEKDLLVDRYRQTADWLASRGRDDDAIALLRQHRELDAFSIDVDIDRLQKAMVAKEQGASSL